MSFKIIRNDITKVKADVIVNTANPKPIYEDGTDAAIYHAAGADALLAERKKIGCIQAGELAVTAAFSLAAKYIIHTVGPVWVDGEHNEFQILENCYVHSLEKALALGCESIAFPLIATGVYGFPKDKALEIAVSVFSRFLQEHEIQIILVVFDKASFQLSGQIVGEIDSYIDENYVKRSYGEFPCGDCGRSPREAVLCNIQDTREYSSYAIQSNSVESQLFSKSARSKEKSFEEEFEELGMTFHDKLFELIDQSGMDNKDIWKKANLDRKHFSKIQCDIHYHPKKKTVMALCIALQLDLDQTKDLLARADWALSPSSKRDLIVQKAIMNHEYDIMKLNMILFQYTNEVLGV